MKKIILASTSPRRKELLSKIVSEFETVSSDYEEDMTLPMSPDELVKFLSKGKAESVAKKYENSLVIGGDTFIAFQDKILGKPYTPEKAREMLKMLSGNTHSVWTGVTVMDSDTQKFISKAIESKITFKELTDEEIENYIKTGEPLLRAGAYAIQTVGETFAQNIEGDYDAIVGLPTKELAEILENFQ